MLNLAYCSFKIMIWNIFYSFVNLFIRSQWHKFFLWIRSIDRLLKRTSLCSSPIKVNPYRCSDFVVYTVADSCSVVNNAYRASAFVTFRCKHPLYGPSFFPFLNSCFYYPLNEPINVTRRQLYWRKPKAWCHSLCATLTKRRQKRREEKGMYAVQPLYRRNLRNRVSIHYIPILSYFSMHQLEQ